MPALAQRSLIKQYMDAGFKLKHSRVIETTAWRWYQCRVACSSIEDFCNKYEKEGGIILDPKNVHKEIQPFDIAIGYGKHAKN